jgi:hypothetical protein
VAGDEHWARFEEALARELGRLPQESFLVLRDPAHEARFAQFWQSLDDLKAEVAGDAVVDGAADPLSERDRQLLAAAGFAPPVSFNTDAGNWWRTIPSPVTAADCRSLARSAVTALRDVQRVPQPGALIYHAWGYATGHRRLDLPWVAPDPAKY